MPSRMPYHIMEVHSTSPKRYYVVTTSTGRKHSKEPLTHSMAKKQLTALHIHAEDKSKK
jgi:hypothetical protein